MMLIVNILLFLCFSFTSCSDLHEGSNARLAGYDLTKPSQTLILPGKLKEISGLTDIDATTVACIQDENGILFIYDIERNNIKEQFNFHIDGDYEGITLVDKSMYVLRSDGTLFEIENYDSKDYKLHTYITGIPANDNEGLCYDPDHNRLLLACKSKIGKGAEYKDMRVIYGFDLKSKKLSAEPVYNFDLLEMKAFAKDKNVALPVKNKKKGTDLVMKFLPSAIAIHPVSDKLYLLSAVDHLLFIFDKNGRPVHIEQLDHEMFNKAEGITFLPNGDMVITNEAEDKEPTLHRFKYLN